MDPLKPWYKCSTLIAHCRFIPPRATPQNPHKKKEVYNKTVVQGRSKKKIRVAVLACDR